MGMFGRVKYRAVTPISNIETREIKMLSLKEGMLRRYQLETSDLVKSLIS
jgi:hypothetical protein